MPYSCWPTRMRMVGFSKMVPLFFARPKSVINADSPSWRGLETGRSSCVTRVQLTDQEWEFIGPYLLIGQYGPYPERLRQQFEGVIRQFRTGGQWREMAKEFGAWSTVLEKAAAEAEKARAKGAASKNKTGRIPSPIPSGRSAHASGVGENRGRRPLSSDAPEAG